MSMNEQQSTEQPSITAEMIHLLNRIVEETEIKMEVTIPEGTQEAELKLTPEHIGGVPVMLFVAMAAVQTAAEQLLTGRDLSQQTQVNVIAGTLAYLEDCILSKLGIGEEDKDDADVADQEEGPKA